MKWIVDRLDNGKLILKNAGAYTAPWRDGSPYAVLLDDPVVEKWVAIFGEGANAYSKYSNTVTRKSY